MRTLLIGSENFSPSIGSPPRLKTTKRFKHEPKTINEAPRAAAWPSRELNAIPAPAETAPLHINHRRQSPERDVGENFEEVERVFIAYLP